MNIDEAAIVFLERKIDDVCDMIYKSYAWNYAELDQYMVYVCEKLEGTNFDNPEKEYSDEIIESFFSKRLNRFFDSLMD